MKRKTKTTDVDKKTEVNPRWGQVHLSYKTHKEQLNMKRKAEHQSLGNVQASFTP